MTAEIRMGDSTSVGGLPEGLPAYAGYVDGNWADFAAIAARYAHAHLVPITIGLGGPPKGAMLDIENGDAIDQDAPVFVAQRGRLWTGLYMSRDRVPAVMPLMAAAKIARNRYKLWTAHYGAGRHICGPTTCGLEWAADGTQWIDHGTWDESVLLADFFSLPPAAGEAPAHTFEHPAYVTVVA